MALCVDKEKCISCMTCVSSFASNFKMNDEGKSEYIADSQISPEDAKTAIEACPVGAISEAA